MYTPSLAISIIWHCGAAALVVGSMICSAMAPCMPLYSSRQRCHCLDAMVITGCQPPFNSKKLLPSPIVAAPLNW
jgi:hypothetical protein